MDYRRWFIYVLEDPRFNLPWVKIRYVGWTYWPDDRFQVHLDYARKGVHYHVCRWIRQLLSLNLEPAMRVIDSGVEPLERWQDAEIFHIKFFREEVEASLTNMTDGGDGITPTEEIKSKVVAFHTGRKRSLEARYNMSLAAIKRSLLDEGEHIQKLAAIHRRSETRAMMSFSAKMRDFDRPRDENGRYSNGL